tara:strand:- start:548 stop:688 length:141 start_codon:yes stop_codon:yes gene_type:complete
MFDKLKILVRDLMEQNDNNIKLSKEEEIVRLHKKNRFKSNENSNFV